MIGSIHRSLDCFQLSQQSCTLLLSVRFGILYKLVRLLRALYQSAIFICAVTVFSFKHSVFF